MADDVGPNEYKCAVCKGVYEKAWSDEEAAAELQANNEADTFGAGRHVAAEECGVVCDVCYNKLLNRVTESEDDIGIRH